MNFKEFIDYVEDNILDFMPSSYENADVGVQEVTKNNGLVLHGLTIRTGESNIVPTLYLDDIFKGYESGDSLDQVMIRIADSYVEADTQKDIDASFITDFESVKSHIVPHLVNREENAEKLMGVPYKMVNDLAAIFYIDVGRNGDGVMQACITNDLMDMYGVDANELYDISVKNLNTISVPSFRGMSEVISQDFGMDVPMPEEEQMYVITNGDKVNGSAQMLNEHLMDQASARIGGDFYIIPSSIHEVLAVPVGRMEVDELEAMVRDVNSTQVAKEDKLSDTVYAFDSVNREVIFGRDLTSVEDRELALMEKVNDAICNLEKGFSMDSSKPYVDLGKEAVKLKTELDPKLFENFKRMAKKHGIVLEKKQKERVDR